MVKLKRIDLNDEIARYEFRPEGKDDDGVGVISINRKTAETKVEVDVRTISSYKFHALKWLREHWKKSDFPEAGMAAWY